MPLDTFLVIILSGLLGSYVLLTLALWMPGVGLPRLDFAKVMSNFMYGETYDGKPPYIAGVIAVYLNGVFFALLYATVIAQYLPGIPLLRGAIWGVILFAVSGLWFVPHFLKEGYFISHVHKQAWISSVIVHAAYGVILGWLCPIVTI